MISITGSINGTTESASYTYDNLGRLVTSNQSTNGVSAQRRFAYDRWGNRTGVWDAVSGGSQIQAITLQQSGGAPTNRIASVNGVSYSYDAAGNVTNDGAHSYTYDAENRVVSVDGGAATYAYDHANRRVKKTINGVITHCVWEGSKLFGEYNGSTGAQLVLYWYAGSRMIAKTEGTATRYFISDRLSVRMVLDVNGNVIGRQGHLPYGEDFGESDVQDKHHFTSYERDSETSTDYAMNRQYSQGVGRFNRVDPLASSANSDTPQTWNRYAYATNDSINKIDPTGLEPPSDPLRHPFRCATCGPPPFPWELDPCSPVGATYTLDGFQFNAGIFCGGPIPAPNDQEPLRPLCSEQDFTFTHSSGIFSASELSAIAQTAVGEAGLYFDVDEIAAVIATIYNRRNYNKAYIDAGRPRGPFNPGTTDIMGILKEGYVAHRTQSGLAKLNQAKALGGGVLYADSYVCDQLVVAKLLADAYAVVSPEGLIAIYPLTYNNRNESAVPRDALNKVKYGQNWFWHVPLQNR